MLRPFALALAAASFVAFSSPADAVVINRIVATVDGEPITLHELESFFDAQRAVLGQTGTTDLDGALQALITEKLVAKEITDKGIRVRDADIDQYIERIEQQNQLEKGQLAQALEQQGLTLAQYRQKVRGEIEKIQLLNREIRGRVNVTPEEVERHYEANREGYRLPGIVLVRHIVFRLSPTASDEQVDEAMAKARKVRERIVEDGEDFAQVAKEVSEDGSAADGGDLGELEVGQMLPEFESALDDLAPNQVSPPVRTRAGVHVLLLEGRERERFTPLEEVSESIREELYNKNLDQRYRRWLLEDLRQRHFVEVKL